jgi:hypothetical protein
MPRRAPDDSQVLPFARTCAKLLMTPINLDVLAVMNMRMRRPINYRSSSSRLMVEIFLKMGIQVVLHQHIHFEEIAQRFT